MFVDSLRQDMVFCGQLSYTSKGLTSLNKYEELFANLKSNEERRAAYKERLKKVHPDVGGTDEEARALIEAYKNSLNSSEQLATPAEELTDEEILKIILERDKWATDVLDAFGLKASDYTITPPLGSCRDFVHNTPVVRLHEPTPPETLLKIEEALRKSWGRVVLDTWGKSAFTPLDIWTLMDTGAPVKLVFTHEGRTTPYTILTRRYLTYIGYNDQRDWDTALKVESVFFNACYHERTERDKALYKKVCSQLICDKYAKGRRAVECYYDKKTLRAYVMHCSDSLRLKDFLPGAEIKVVSGWLI